MLCASQQVFLRLDFWGAFVDLLGLTVLLSYDVQFLKPVLNVVTHFRYLQRIRNLRERLRRSVVSFFGTMHGPLMPERLETLQGADATAFLKVFHDWVRGPAIPVSGITVWAVYLDPGARGELWIYAAETTQPPNLAEQPLAGPLPLSAVITQLDKQVQNFIYAIGFVLMAFGSILSMVSIATSHH